MQELPYEIKALAHHTLQRHGVYRLEMPQLQEMLILLRQEPKEQSTEIQQSLFEGIVQFHQQYKDKISQRLSDPSFDYVSNTTKSLLHKILHEYHFLASIKAWEIFLPHFPKPYRPSSSNSLPSTGQLLDDQYEKARLNYLYYGPMNVYNLSQSLPPLPMLPERPIYHSPFNSENSYPKLNSERISSRPFNKKQSHYQTLDNDEDVMVDFVEKKSKQLDAPQKKKALENNGTSKYSNNFLERLERENQAIGKQATLMNCLCQGQVRNSRVFRCKCKKYFHCECVNHQTLCLICRQASIDPFYEIICLVDSFPLNFQKAGSFQGLLQLSTVTDMLSTTDCELLISCSHPNEPGITQPDDIRVFLGQYPVFEIPALLENHQQKQRKDRQFVITPYIKALQSTHPNMERMKFTILVMDIQDGEKRRNNKKGIFQLCFFLVKKLTPEQLFKKITDRYEFEPLISPFQWSFSETEPESLELSFLDPYTSEIMEIPARGSKCKHLPCFDLKTYISMIYHLGDHDWKCPLCLQDSRQLVIDKYLLSLLNAYKKEGKIPKKVTFFKDGRRECLMAAEQQDMDGQ